MCSSPALTDIDADDDAPDGPVNAPTLLTALPEGAFAPVLTEIADSRATPILFVARDDSRMAALHQSLTFFAHSLPVFALPAWDCLPYDRSSPHPSIVSKRVESLCEMAALPANKPAIIITTVNAMLQRVPPKHVMAHESLIIRESETLNRDGMFAFLTRHGYSRVGKVMEPGEFAVRGSIIDLFPSGAEQPTRIDCFGDEIESLHHFDALEQTSDARVASITLLPASEVFMDEENITRFRKGFRDRFGAAYHKSPLYASVSAGRKHTGMEHWLPLFHAEMVTLLDYLPSATPLVLDHLTDEAMAERFDLIQDYYQAREDMTAQKSLGDSEPYHALPPEMLYLTERKWEDIAHHYDTYAFTPFKVDDSLKSAPLEGERARPSEREGQAVGGSRTLPHPYMRSYDFATARAQEGGHATLMRDVMTHIRNQQHSGRKALIACHTDGSRERVRHMLSELDVHTVQITAWDERKKIKGKSVGLVTLPLEHGFQNDTLLVLTEQDIFGERIIRATRKKSNADKFFEEAATLEVGALVVHKEHGIGRFAGLETVTAGSAPHDCFKIIYEGDDRLFVPVENSDILSRYGSEEDGGRLDKLGGVAWQARKAKLKERIKMAADALLKIAAERALTRADALYPPEGMYDEFCARFPYSETEDQLNAINDVIGDLGKDTPMDRLICGDVGFGKTEVALRAAFVAAAPQGNYENSSLSLRERAGGEGNVPQPASPHQPVSPHPNPLPEGEGTQSARQQTRKQVALVCPTTLLARQHYQTFKERFANLPYEIRQLSRLTMPKQNKETKELLTQGLCDIVIGTHAVLAQSMDFANLGLLIVDEEQHFGVKQKERLKELRANVHVLTLSATPIPRTLQMALTGVKELSLITTPPIDRLAVRTFVIPYDPIVLREAILREHFRGGQSFYVCPRVKDLSTVANQVKALVPEIKTVTAHGQLPAAELDQIMNDFYEGKFDMLIATNIIESGLDIPTANTLIVHRAHMFGLSQLYQIRGRVGRGKTRAYAYLTLPHGKPLSKNALKRLEVMQTLDTLGAGFTIASHDMDIRGFGNVLGEEQSGHIKEVGMELYQQMLEEAVEAAKAEGRGLEHADSGDSDFSPVINLGMPVLIPVEYVDDLSLRLGLYRRAGTLKTEAEVEAFAAEMIDRFGPLPPEMENLLEVVQLKQHCKRLNVAKLDAGPKGAILTFHNNIFSNPAALLDYINRHPDQVKLRPDQTVVLMRDWKTLESRVRGVKKALSRIGELV